MLQEYQKKLLELLEQLELEVSNLYKLFADKFPRHSELWGGLSDDEVNHAAYIKKLSSLALEGKVSFAEKTTKTFTVKTIIDDIKSRYQKIHTAQYPLINALVLSLNLEESIIESRFYDFFISGDPAIIEMLNKIKEETREHAAKVKKTLEEEKKHRQ